MTEVIVKLPRKNALLDGAYLICFSFLLAMAYLNFYEVSTPYNALLGGVGPYFIVAMFVISSVFRGEEKFQLVKSRHTDGIIRLISVNQFLYLVIVLIVFAMSVMHKFGINSKNGAALFWSLFAAAIFMILLPFWLETKIRKLIAAQVVGAA